MYFNNPIFNGFQGCYNALVVSPSQHYSVCGLLLYLSPGWWRSFRLANNELCRHLYTQWTMNSVTLGRVWLTVYNGQSTLSSVQCALYNVQCTMCSVRCTILPWNVQWMLEANKKLNKTASATRTTESSMNDHEMITGSSVKGFLPLCPVP